MLELKQAIIVRKDLNLSRKDLASQVAQASLKFIIENNEAERGGQLIANLSSDEITWLTGSFLQDIVMVDTKDEIDDIIFRAELMGIETYSNFTSNGKGQEDLEVSCVALGPDESGVIDRLIHGLKSI